MHFITEGWEGVQKVPNIYHAIYEWPLNWCVFLVWNRKHEMKPRYLIQYTRHWQDELPFFQVQLIIRQIDGHQHEFLSWPFYKVKIIHPQSESRKRSNLPNLLIGLILFFLL
jgi:hypothetical protein